MVKYEKWLKENTSLLTNRLAIVVGATGAIGSKVVDYLLYLKAKVIIAARNLDKAKKLENQMKLKYPNSIIYVELLDVSNLESIDQFQSRIDKNYPKVDYLFNNAGIYHMKTTFTKDGYEIHFATNTLGNYYLTKRLLFDLAPNAKMIFTTSIAYNFHKLDLYDIQSAKVKGKMHVYANTKRMLTFNTLALKNELSEHDYVINLVHPGICATNLFSLGHSKFFHYTIYQLMRLVFHSADKAALSLIKGAFVETKNDEWIGPRVCDIWGKPKISKLDKSVLKIEKQQQVQHIIDEMINNHNIKE